MPRKPRSSELSAVRRPRRLLSRRAKLSAVSPFLVIGLGEVDSLVVEPWCQSAPDRDPVSAPSRDLSFGRLVPVGPRALRSARPEADAAARGRGACGLPVRAEAQVRPVLEPLAFIARLDDVAMMRQPVEQRCGHFGVAKHARPFTEHQVGGDDHRGLLIETADQVEQQLTAGWSAPLRVDRIKRQL
jgi:hypothetical protein